MQKCCEQADSQKPQADRKLLYPGKQGRAAVFGTKRYKNPDSFSGPSRLGDGSRGDGLWNVARWWWWGAGTAKQEKVRSKTRRKDWSTEVFGPLMFVAQREAGAGEAGSGP